MAQTAHPIVDRPQPVVEPSSRSHRSPQFAERQGHLAQLVNSINLSPGVQAQRAMARQMNRAPIQCKLMIGASREQRTEALSEQQIEEFLRSHGQHYFFGFKSVFDDVDGDFYGEEGAQNLARELTRLLNVELRKKEVTQDSVQQKLIEICELVRVGRDNLTALKDDAETKEWYDQVALNGLCLGFTEIFKEHTDWELALWNSIVRWTPAAGSPAQVLAALNHHLDQTIRWSRGEVQHRALEGVLLLKEAWEGMDYEQPAPGWLSPLTGTESATKLLPAGQMTRRVTSHQEARAFIVAAGQRVSAESERKDSAYILEISTPHHSMMARLKGGEIDVIESEETGTGRVSTWGQLADFLQDAIFIGADQATGTALDIDIKQMVPSDAEGNDRPVTSGILADLEIESRKTFEGLDAAGDLYEFLERYNQDLWRKIWPEEQEK